MPGVAFFKLGGDEFCFGAFEQLVPKLRVQLFGQCGMPGQEAVFHHRGADGVIFGPEAQAVFHRAGGMPNFEFQIPQDVKHGFDHTL